jgi:protein O-GlcNAc transferase
MRTRVSAAFYKFIDVQGQTDIGVAQLSRDLGIDIAIDLKGETEDSRMGMFAEGCAPIQVSYLGYPGTIGALYIDYIIADTTVIPAASKADFTEKIVYLPNSYQANDSKRKITERGFSRTELGLPDLGFVFCCFNSSYKILPSTFDSWMKILKAVPGSVLWLMESNATATNNLRKNAKGRGVDSGRLVFAKHMPLHEHLARHSAGDLFLDTLPCNAHTTASDALWTGMPVLTLLGRAFAGRVAASLLKALDLQELITATPEDYEKKAIELATHPEKLHQLKNQLKSNKDKSSLFDGKLFAGYLEAAFEAMFARYRADLPPEVIEIQPYPL